MQLTKGTAKQYGLDPNERSNPDKNLQVGFKLLKDNYYILQKNGIEPTPINVFLPLLPLSVTIFDRIYPAPDRH